MPTNRKGVAKHVHRELSEGERARTRAIFETEEAHKEEVVAAARARRAIRKKTTVFLKEIFQLLRDERNRQELSLADMMERTGITRGSLSNLENGRQDNPTMETVIRCAEALGVDIKVRLEPHANRTGRQKQSASID